MLRRLYDWTLSLAAHDHAPRWLGFVSFIESSIFPIPPDVLLLPMVMARRERAWFYATICTVASILGGFAGYALGYFLFDTLGQPVLAFYGYEDQFQRFQSGFNEWGAWLVFIFGLTFFPFKVITIASGVTHLDFWIFAAASLASRTPRFFIETTLLWACGDPIRRFIEKRLGLVTSVAVICFFLGFLLIKYL